MSITMPMCALCRHFRGLSDESLKMSCEAFPAGIPDDILDGAPHYVSRFGEETFEAKDKRGAATVAELWPPMGVKHLGDQHDQHTHAGGAAFLRGKLERDGGFTYQPVTHRSPKDGMMVAREGRERIIEGKPSVEDIRSYLKDNAKDFEDTEAYAGGWFNPEDGKTYLDVSERHTSAASADRASRKNHQEAYYDLATGETVYTRARKKTAPWSFSSRDDGQRDPSGARPDVRSGP